MAQVRQKLWEKHNRLGNWSRPKRAECPRWEERMEIGTLMATVCRTHWIANAVAFQNTSKGSETGELLSACGVFPEDLELRRNSRVCDGRLRKRRRFRCEVAT